VDRISSVRWGSRTTALTLSLRVPLRSTTAAFPAFLLPLLLYACEVGVGRRHWLDAVEHVEQAAQVVLRNGHKVPVRLVDHPDGRAHDPREVEQLDAGDVGIIEVEPL
jgi:hypothetical protein